MFGYYAIKEQTVNNVCAGKITGKFCTAVENFMLKKSQKVLAFFMKISYT